MLIPPAARAVGRAVTVAAAAAITLLGAAAAHAQGYNATVQSTPGLVAYYTFTTAAQANSVVNGYTGTLQNGATVSGPGGGPPISDPSSSALVLNNGASGTKYATAGGGTPLLGGVGSSGSILAWINLASLPSQRGRIFSIAGESQLGNDLDLQIENDQLRFYTDGGSYTGASSIFGTGDLNRWIFVAGTFTNNVGRSVYINGALAGSSVPGAHAANGAPFYVGQSTVFPDRSFDGAVSNVALYDRQLTGAEVAAIYASRLVSPAAGPTSPVPEPSTYVLFGTGLLALGAGVRRRVRA
jgi:hypothetical protein